MRTIISKTKKRRRIKMTDAERIRCYMRAAMYMILELIAMGEEEYYAIQFKHGIEWLELMSGGDKEDVRRISGNPMFWAIWKMHWYRRDEAFIAAKPWNVMGVKAGGMVYMYNRWLLLHSPKYLAAGTTNYAQALELSYTRELIPYVNLLKELV